jgi:hypothetical protein
MLEEVFKQRKQKNRKTERVVSEIFVQLRAISFSDESSMLETQRKILISDDVFNEVFAYSMSVSVRCLLIFACIVQGIINAPGVNT